MTITHGGCEMDSVYINVCENSKLSSVSYVVKQTRKESSATCLTIQLRSYYVIKIKKIPEEYTVDFINLSTY